jgi:hypothetical protein
MASLVNETGAAATQSTIPASKYGFGVAVMNAGHCKFPQKCGAMP